MRKPLFIGIGVHAAKGLALLPGVLPSLDGLIDWADATGYETVRIDDAGGKKVSVDRITNALAPIDPESGEHDPALLLDRQRIVLYFCGHGLHVPLDQYWVLSAGPDQADERISASAIREALASYGPKQVSVISDACRTPQALQGWARTAIPTHPGQAPIVEKDNFLSTLGGRASYSMPAADGDQAYCVFSRVLLRALSEPPESDALDKLYKRLGEEVVSSQSLAGYLRKHVPDAALDIDKDQVPQCDPGFCPEINDYVRFPVAGAGMQPEGVQPSSGGGLPPRSGAVPAGRDILPSRIREADAQLADDWDQQHRNRIARSRSEWRKPYAYEFAKYTFQNFAARERPGYRDGYFVASSRPPILSTVIGKYGALQPDLPDPASDFPWLSNREHQTYWGSLDGGFAFSGLSSVLLCSTSDLIAAIPQFRGLWCDAIIEGPINGSDGLGGVEFLGWGDARHPAYYLPDDIVLSAAEALKGLSSGTLVSSDMPMIASEMRRLKHADPLYGIVSAYLYHRIGDIDNIRRMCYYYQWHEQDVPFDIALLAQLELRDGPGGGFSIYVPAVPEVPEALRPDYAPSFTWERTPEVSVAVAGVTPVVRSGWQFLAQSPHRVHRACSELAGHLTESPVATLHGREAIDHLIAIFREL